jgi:type VI secretion system secreted protein Hcp
MAAADYFLKLDGIKGESVDDKHKDWIQLESFSWGVTNTAHISAGGGGGGRATFSDFEFTAPTTTASPQLFLACASGKHIKTGMLSVRKAGESQFEYLKLTFTNLLVSFYKERGPAAAENLAPQDSVGLLFQKVVFDVMNQSLTGGVTAPTTAAADLATGQTG